jgi:hypothetical protein
MITATAYYSSPKNRELVKASQYARLNRIGKVPEAFRIKEGRNKGWIGSYHESDNSRTSHEVAPRAVKHTGWFVDSFESATACGIVVTVRIPRRRARLDKVAADEVGTFTRVRFVEGIREQWGNDIVSRLSRDLHDDERDAAVSADSEAQAFADACRDSDAKFQAEREIEEAKGEIKATREEVKAILSERKIINQTNLFHETPFRGEVPAVCRAIRSQVSQGLARVAKLRERIETIESDYWQAVAR